MALGKWIGGFLGLLAAGPLGALAGYALGSLLDGDSSRSAGNGFFGQGGNAYSGQGGYGTGGNYYEEPRQAEGTRNAFRFSLLVLASYIIKADGKVMHSEMNAVRSFLRQNFGEAAVSEGEEILRKLFEQQRQLGAAEYRSAVISSCQQLRQAMTYEMRLQLLAFLAQIAQADGVVTAEEVTALKDVAVNLGLSAAEVEQMLNLKDASTNLDAAYKVLGVSPSATDQEVKAAYRKLALQHHPDRVATLGEDVKKAAEKKFQEINAAKDLVYKARGM